MCMQPISKVLGRMLLFIPFIEKRANSNHITFDDAHKISKQTISYVFYNKKVGKVIFDTSKLFYSFCALVTADILMGLYVACDFDFLYDNIQQGGFWNLAITICIMIGIPGFVFCYPIDSSDGYLKYFRRYSKCSNSHNAVWHFGVITFTVFLICLWIFLAKIVIHYGE